MDLYPKDYAIFYIKQMLLLYHQSKIWMYLSFILIITKFK